MRRVDRIASILARWVTLFAIIYFGAHIAAVMPDVTRLLVVAFCTITLAVVVDVVVFRT